MLMVVLLSAKVLTAAEPLRLRPAAGSGITEAAALQLTNSNLVDLLSELPLNLRIARAEISGTTLAVDLKMQTSAGGVSPVYEDMAKLGSLALLRSGNMEQLRLRFVAEDPWTGDRHLLLAAELNRDELSGQVEQVLGQLDAQGESPLEEALKEQLHIVETALWKKAFSGSS